MTPGSPSNSWPLPFADDRFDDEEIAFTGRARLVEDEGLHVRVGQAVGDDPAKGIVFELDLETALHKHRRGGLTYDVWRAAADQEGGPNSAMR